MSPLLPAWPLAAVVLVLLVVGALGVAADDPIRHVRGRLRLALGVSGAVLLGSWIWGTAQPSLLGLPIVVGPGAAAAAGVLVFAALPSRAHRPGSRRTAGLRVRSAQQVVGGRVLALPVALLAVLIGVLVACGLSAATTGDAIGRSFAISGPQVGASAGPYPGWYYGLPILLTCTVLVVAVLVAVRRTVLLPAVNIDDAVDDAWRLAVGRTLAAIAAAGLLLYLAGVLWAAQVVWKVLEQTGTTGLQPVAQANAVASGLCAIAAVVLVAVAAVRVASVGRAATTGSVVA